MLRSECKVGMKVHFGRANGEKTLGEVIKMNPQKAKVRTLEERGNGRGSGAGALWNVPYSMMTPAEVDGAAPSPVMVRRTLDYNVFQPREDILILQAICVVYDNLSPENLSCDGEATVSHMNQVRSECNRKLKGLFAALGRTVTEEEAYEWDRQRQEAAETPVVPIKP